jgi:hypothetical protein
MTAKQIEHHCKLLQCQHEKRWDTVLGSEKSLEERQRDYAATVQDFLAALDLLKAAETEYSECMRDVGNSECKFITPELTAIAPIRMEVFNLVHRLSYRIYEHYEGLQPKLAAPVAALGLDQRDAKRLLAFGEAQKHWAKIFQLSEQIKFEKRAVIDLL